MIPSFALRSAAVGLAFSLALPWGISQAATTAPALMPLPARIAPASGTLALTPAFTYTLDGNQETRLLQGARRLIARIGRKTGLSLAQTPVHGAATLTIRVPLAAEALPQPEMDESYTLTVDAQQIVLAAKTDIGALRGMETLLQLIAPQGAGFVLPALRIDDAPRFAWRGLMIDSGRHFLPVSVILRNLDGMAAVKLNVLHWHLSEDQGFRIESRLYPKLQALGSNGQYYTQEEVREVVAYAAARGIRVVPEFDMPGHAQSWFAGYPELASAPGPFTPDPTFGISDAAMDPTRESTYAFIDGFLGEMAALFPDPYMHIGGDESNGKQWLANPAIVAFMQAHNFKTTAELQTYFNQRLQKILAAHHKQMVGWDEILHPDLPRETVIQNWHGIQFLIDSAKQGHRVLLSKPFYLDHTNEPAEKMFLADPLPTQAGLTPAQQQMILGGEACMWSEHVVPETIDSRIWPRAAAIAERLWSPASDRDVPSMYSRLKIESLRLEAEGLTHLSGPERMQRQLAGIDDPRALTLFAQTLEPNGFGARTRLQRTTTRTVLDRLVDAVRPDPTLRYDFAQAVDAALSGDAAARAQLRTLFQSWIDNAPALARIEAGSPLLQEAHTHIAAWPKLGTMGLEALKALDAGTPQTADWLTTQKATLRSANKPEELVQFVVLGPLGKLTQAAAKSR